MVISKKVFFHMCIFFVGLACFCNLARGENEHTLPEKMQRKLSAREVDNELLILHKQIKELEKQKEKLLRQLQVSPQKRHELELRAIFALRPITNMQEKVHSIQQELDSKKERVARLKGLNYPTLTVRAKPANARIKILNIRPVYHPGIVLNPGKYLLEVSARGCGTKRKWVKLAPGQDKEIMIILDVKSFTDMVTGMEFVYVPGGCYEMGCGNWTSDCAPDEKPVHTVCVDDFYIGKYEVTQGQWKKIMHSNPSSFPKGDHYPVESISWNDIQKFIKELNKRSNRQFRLPTEAEWEYAARSGGKKGKYAGGDNVDRIAWFKDNSGGHTHPVGQKAPNGLGIYDMSGNVGEWCHDWYSENYYSKSPRNNPLGPSSGLFRVFRGGSWYSMPGKLRSAYRNNGEPSYTTSDLGFRLVLPIGQAGR